MSSSEPTKLEEADALIAWVLSQPGISKWVKTALTAARERDPVDVLNELEVLNHALRLRSEVWLAHAYGGRRA